MRTTECSEHPRAEDTMLSWVRIVADECHAAAAVLRGQLGLRQARALEPVAQPAHDEAGLDPEVGLGLAQPAEHRVVDGRQAQAVLGVEDRPVADLEVAIRSEGGAGATSSPAAFRNAPPSSPGGSTTNSTPEAAAEVTAEVTASGSSLDSCRCHSHTRDVIDSTGASASSPKRGGRPAVRRGTS